jgi:hypothetical protein
VVDSTIQSYPVNTDVTVRVTLATPDDVSAVSYVVMDELGNVLQAATPIVDYAVGDTTIEVTVPAALNLLPTTPPPPANGQFNDAKVPLRGMRVIDFLLTTSSGVITSRTRYSISTTNRLVELVNSFQSYDQALLESFSMPPQVGFEAATEDQRITALIEAFFRLTKFGYHAKHPTFIDNPPAGGWDDFWPQDLLPPQFWTVMTMDRWALYLDSFKLALRRAQIAEANAILQGDPVRDRRNSGILSETTGKSSMMFRAGKPINLGISLEALEYVKNFIQLRMTVTRT